MISELGRDSRRREGRRGCGWLARGRVGSLAADADGVTGIVVLALIVLSRIRDERWLVRALDILAQSSNRANSYFRIEVFMKI